MPKGNPNPSPSTRSSSEDNPARGRGRQKGARDRLSAAFLTALADTFEELNDKVGSKGLDALKKVRDEDPAVYARVVASLLPKEIEIKRPLDELSDEELAYLIATLKERVPAPAAMMQSPRAQRQRSTKPSVRVLCRSPSHASLSQPRLARASLQKKARHPEGQRARSTRVRTCDVSEASHRWC